MAVSLDEKDQKIIRALYQDSRAPLAKIARKTGIPRDSIKYRIKRMEDRGIIKAYAVLCDPAALGHPVFTWVHVKTQQHDQKKEKLFFAHLQSIPEVVYISKTTGVYHYMLAVAAKDVPDLDRLLSLMFSVYPEMIKEYNTSFIVEELQYDKYDGLF